MKIVEIEHEGVPSETGIYLDPITAVAKRVGLDPDEVIA